MRPATPRPGRARSSSRSSEGDRGDVAVRFSARESRGGRRRQASPPSALRPPSVPAPRRRGPQPQVPVRPAASAPWPTPQVPDRLAAPRRGHAGARSAPPRCRGEGWSAPRPSRRRVSGPAPGRSGDWTRVGAFRVDGRGRTGGGVASRTPLGAKLARGSGVRSLSADGGRCARTCLVRSPDGEGLHSARVARRPLVDRGDRQGRSHAARPVAGPVPRPTETEATDSSPSSRELRGVADLPSDPRSHIEKNRGAVSRR
jgi:hypothetical protein